MRTERVGFAVCGSFCTHEKVMEALEEMTKRYETVIPILSETAAVTDTRFGTSDELRETMERLTGRKVLCGIPAVEPIWTEGDVRCIGHRAGYGEYDRKAGCGNHGHDSHYGRQGPLAQWSPGGDSRCQQ